MTAEDEIKAMLNAKAKEYDDNAQVHLAQAEKHKKVADIAFGKAAKLYKLATMVDEP